MTPAKLIAKNLVRRKGRFVFTLLGIVIAGLGYALAEAGARTGNHRDFACKLHLRFLPERY